MVKVIKFNNLELRLNRTLIMGILNVAPDSFSDGGLYTDVDHAVNHAKEMVAQGADIIDIGAESSRPYSDPISVEEEINRVKQVITRLVKEISVPLSIPLSIDTYKPDVAYQCLKLGVHMVNDISGLRNNRMIEILKDVPDVPVVVMHMKGEPKNMQENPVYNDVVLDIKNFLKERIKVAKHAGIGFGKTVEHNLEILKNLSEFKELGCPILVGTSRKSFLGKLTGLDVKHRLEATLASISIAIMNGADIIRVHDVSECKIAAQIADAVKCV